jgi:transposase
MSMPLLPFPLPGLIVERVSLAEPPLLIDARTRTPDASCPDGHTPSARVHSRYTRRLRDLPVTEYPVCLRVHVRRFRCRTSTCPRRTLAERLPALAPGYAQRTGRLTETVRCLGSEAGGEAGARRATRLRMPLRGDTVLRMLRCSPTPAQPTPRVRGIDDCALRKGRVYGTILVDLAQQRPIALLPERTAETGASWLRDHPGVAVIARERASDSARGATAGAPNAVQVADRLHLLCNLREALPRSLPRITPTLRGGLARELTPAPPSLPEPCETPPSARPLPRYGWPPRLQQEQQARHAARRHRSAQGKTRFAPGHALRPIAAAWGLDTTTVRAWGRSETLPPEQRGSRGPAKIDAYSPYLRTRLAEGCTNQCRLWRAIRDHGFTGTRSLVAKWIHAHGHAPAGPPHPPPPRLPAARQRTWLLLQSDAQRTPDKQALWERLQQHDELRQGAALLRQGTTMIRPRQADTFAPWLQACQASTSVELRHCAEWLRRDAAAVKAALTLPGSTGPVEGHINRLQRIKRSGYGRMQWDLLRERVLYDAA